MRLGLMAVLAALIAGPVCAQQVADPVADVSVERPFYRPGAGPTVGIDGAHRNFHTAEGRFAPFAAVLRNDGYVVAAFDKPLSAEALSGIQVLVIANPRGRDPTAAAYADVEAAALKAWIERGGALFLILDHMPFPAAGRPVAEALGFDFVNGHAVLGVGTEPEFFTVDSGALAANEITQGAGPGTAVSRIQSFAGSSFRAPPNAIPLIRFDGPWEIRTPKEAWAYTPETPRRPATRDDLRGAALRLGRGRVVVVSEAAMFTAQVAQGVKVGMNAPTAAQNKQFLLNLMHWLSGATRPD